MRIFVTIFISFIMILPAAASHIPADSITQANISDICFKGVKLLRMKRFKEAREHFSRGERLAASDSLLKRKCIRAIGNSHYMEGMQAEIDASLSTAYASYTKALDIFTGINSTNDMALALRRMASLNDLKLRLYDRALTLYRQAYDLACEINDRQLQGLILIDMILVRDKQSAWIEKNELNIRLDSLLALSDDNNLRFQRSLINGDLASQQGKHQKAERFYKQAITYINPANPGSHYYDAYFKLRENAIKMRQFHEALAYGDSCVDIFRRGFKPDNPNRFRPFGTQAAIYAKLGDEANCFRCADSMFLMLKVDPKLKGLTKMRLYIQRGEWNMDFGKYEAAAADFATARKILALCDTNEARHHALSVMPLHAGALSQAGEKAEALEIYTEYAARCRSTYGEKSKKYAEAIGYLANLEGAMGKTDSGSRHYRQAAELMLNAARRELRLASSAERESRWNDISSIFWAMAAYGINNHLTHDEFSLAAYNALLFSKGQLLSSEKSWESAIYASADPQLIEQYQRLLKLKSRLSESSNTDSQLDTAFTEMNTIDHILTKRLHDMGLTEPADTLTFKDVTSSLQPGELLVDFADYWLPGDRRQYVAYVMGNEWEYPRLIPVTTSDSIDALLNIVNRKPDRLYESRHSADMLRLFWNPLQPYADAARRIYVIPSGDIHQIAISSIPLPDGSTLGDKHEIIRLTSAKEVVSIRNNRQLNKRATAALFGDIDYDVDIIDMEAQSRRYPIPAFDSNRGSDSYRGDSIFKKLHYSSQEVTEIGRILAHNNVSVNFYTKLNGSEEAFMSLSGNSPHMMLMSTHGFYYTPAHAPSHTTLARHDDIMYLTGLVMSGGNAEWTGRNLPDGVRGGLLTSDDISHLDFSATGLVALSACETACGQATNDGLYGLQRAFKKAGAQTLVMSLWQVSDLVAKEFMIRFFDYLPSSGWDKRDAFNKAKAAIRAAYPEPFYWAAFIMVD